MKNVAIFDFDDTLIIGDSFMPFLFFAAGVKAYAVLALALLSYILQFGRSQESLRTYVKGFLLRRLLKDKDPQDFEKAFARLLKWRKFNEPIMNALREHRAKGDMIVIASGSLDVYMPKLLRDIPHDHLICTAIGFENGRLTGEMALGNCVRLRKAERVKEWLETNGPFLESFGYGNLPHDLPMLNLVKHHIIVS